MKAVGIFNGIRNSYYQDYLRGVNATSIPYPIELTPEQEIARLESLIADEQETIRGFGSSRVALDAKVRISHYEIEIQKWRAAIFAAEQESFDRAVRATIEYPNFLERRAWWVELVKERIGR